ncbi:MAG: FAD-dependent oxidoreductase [Vicinamibacterales bacterium]
MPVSPRVIVIGAGAFGGWTALSLQRRGARVTLIDARNPGHPHTSSGGQTRIIRATYGAHRLYTHMAARAFRRWLDEDTLWGHGCLRPAGALWMSAGDPPFARASEAALADEGVPFERLSRSEASTRWPQVNFYGIDTVLHEPAAGFLLASRACGAVAARFVAEGGTMDRAELAVCDDPSRLQLTSGERLEADAVVVAAGPWLGRLFPDLLGGRIVPTRQVSHYFATPAGDRQWLSPALPIWLEVGEHVMYGIPGDDGKGFKIGNDTAGPAFDMSTADRTIGNAEVEAIREYLRLRFPGLAAAPSVGGEVCQYEATPDGHFVIDTHPGNRQMWIVGGGSGHGFKMGPVVGDMVADAVLGRTAPDPAFCLARFAALHGNVDKWSR